jgi:thiol-disulfide isomerase/thioredoxin
MIYLKNGYDIEMNVKSNIIDSNSNKISNFRESINFKGKGSDINNFLFEYNLRQSESGMNLYDQMMSLDSIGINTALDSINKTYIKEVSELTNDNHFLEIETINRDNFKKSYISFWTTKQEISKHNGKKSPYFNYENLKGGTTSIDDLKGKYLYIDIWATWCGPCKDEFPSFRKLEKKYHGIDYLDFVSISIDNIKDRDKWIEMVNNEGLSGTHLLADKDWKSQYVIDNMIDKSGIPRYIIVDPKGYIVNSNAPRPSQEKKLYNIIDNLEQNMN